MDIHHKDLSLKFYSFLCDVIGTKEVVNKRRYIFAAKDDLELDDIAISSGSKAEGLDLAGSDYDLMIVDSRVQVFEKLDQVKNIDGKLPLIMDTENTKVGFTRLLIHPAKSFPSHYIDWRTGFSYLSSTLFRQMISDDIKKNAPGCGFYIHGPCTTTPHGEIDIASSLRCPDWISTAQQWIIRTKYSWASDGVIRNILSFSVLFVPIESKNSHYTDLEWRISFSYAEKLLIFCFNHVQLFCYALLKIILKDIVKKIFGDLLCSYFMKTIIFWLCEETKLSYWKEEHIISCFMTCFKRLVYCVENKTCLHLFIPENNLFENRFEKQHQKLLLTLHGLYNQGWTCLLQTETLHSFGRYSEPTLSSNMSIATFFPGLEFLLLYVKNINREFATIMKRCMYQTIQYRAEIDIYMCLLSGLCQSVAIKDCNDNLVLSNNRVLYQRYQRRLINLLIGLNHDAASGWLLLATFFFTNKQYNISKTIIDHCFSKVSPESNKSIFEEDCSTLQQRFIKQNLAIGLRCLKTCNINIGANCSIIPNELKLLVEKDSLLYIPPLVYAHLIRINWNSPMQS